jgi:hypothetical protein
MATKLRLERIDAMRNTKSAPENMAAVIETQNLPSEAVRDISAALKSSLR